MSETTGELAGEQHLHIATLWLPAAEAMIGMLVPVVIASIFLGPFAMLWYAGCFVLLPTAVFHAFRFFTLTYQLEQNELVIRSGILSKRERRIPLDRIQEVKVRQSILHQLLGLARIDLSTAGKDAKGAALNVLTRQEAERLKSAITTKQVSREVSAADHRQGSSDAPDYEFRLNFKTLLLGGFSSKVVATLGAIVSAFVYFHLFMRVGDNWGNPVAKQIEKGLRDKGPRFDPFEMLDRMADKLPDFIPFGFLTDFFLHETLGKSILLATGGLIFTVGSYAIRYFNFRLDRHGDMLSTSHGLLTLHHGTLARSRIQALKLDEGLLRRWFGLAAVRVDSAGDRNQVDENKNREVLLPVASRAQAEEVACQAIPGLTGIDPIWQRVSPRAVLRGSNKGWLLVALVILLAGNVAGWTCLALIPAFPLVYLLNYQWYRHAGYWLGDDYLLWRSGWINRSTVCLPIRNIQNVSLIQSPFDRRLDLATLSVDIAGQSNTGGGPKIKHLPVEEAKCIQNRLTDRAAGCEFVW